MNYKNLIFSILSVLLLGCAQVTPAMEKENQKQITPPAMDIFTNVILFQACEKGNLGLVKHLIEKGTGIQDVNIHDERLLGSSLLHFTCLNNNSEVTQYLLDKKANVDATNNESNTPLHCACQNNKLENIKCLITNGANINAKNKHGETPLSITCRLGYLEATKYLIENGAFIEAENKDKFTPLYFACGSNQLKTVEYLLEKGANIEAKAYLGATPLLFTCSCGNLEIAQHLISKGANTNIKVGDQNINLLVAAVWKKHTNIVQYLLNIAPELIEAQTVNGFTALDFAYDQKNESIINLFKKRGIQTISEKEAEANMRAFFAELDQEAQQKQMARTKKKRRNIPNQQHQNITQTNKQKNNTTAPDFAPVVAKSYDGHGKATTGRLITNDIIQPVVDSSTITTAPVISTEIVPVHVNNTSNEPTTSASSSTCITNYASSKAPITITTKQPNTVQNSSSNKSQPTQTNNEYQIGYDKKLKWPRSLNGTHYNSMRDHLRQLKHWPETTELDTKPLKGQSDMYRLRVGGYRVVFMIDATLHRIIIHEIGLRKKVYRNL